jgi:hypothetical protein
MSQTAQAATETAADGRHDFDFLFGTSRVENRKLRDPLGGDRSDWIEFTATAHAAPILDGLGNYDNYVVEDFPGRGRYVGFGLRLFDPTSGLWRIWWASTVSDGQLDNPVVGRFENGEGRFECEDVLQGQAVIVRFDWTNVTKESARWQQSFSFDAGRTFEPNWMMDWRKVR